MPSEPKLENPPLSGEEAPRVQRDPTRDTLDKNRDSLSAGLIQPRSEASLIRTWINNIHLYRFPLALAVVAVHSGEFVATLSRTNSVSSHSFGLWAVEFLTMLSRLATPSFLLIAGLVFCKDGTASQAQYFRKIKSRCHSLLVPYLAWNFLAVLLLCAPLAINFFYSPESTADAPVTLGRLAKWMMGWPIYPADAPLWFVRDLLLLIAIVPLLNFIPPRVQILGLAALFIYWLSSPMDLIPGGMPRAFSVLFFMMGVAIGMNQVLLSAMAKAEWLIYTAGAILLFSAAAGATCTILGTDYSGLRTLLERMVRVSGALLVVGAGARSRFPNWLSDQLNRLSPAAFFLFASHYLVFLCLAKLFAKFTQNLFRPGYEVLLFGLVFSIVIAISLASYFLMRRYTPSLLGMLDGNRSTRAAVNPLNRQLELETPLAPPLPVTARSHSAT